jgi:hypothetical protein
MSITAADLTDDVKRQLLDHIKGQVGASNYDQMVDTVGEDKLLDAFLAQAAQGGSSSAAGREGPWKSAFQVMWGLWISTWLWMLAFSGGPAGFLAVLGGMLLTFFLAAIYYQVSAQGRAGFTTIFSVILLLGGVGGVGYGLWVGLPWLWGGVRQWWSWVGSHF